MNRPLPSPVPQKLQEMLKDYPELIQRLQDVLDEYVKEPNPLMPFDGAIWALEGRLESFLSEAREELKVAQASGDLTAIQRAEQKEFLMFHSGSKNGGMSNLGELRNYIEQHKAVLG